MHHRGPNRQDGFTLLEILVVVVIIGILTALLMPNLNAGGRWRDLNREAATLAARIRVAQDDAMLSGREYGIAFTQDGYRFVRWDSEVSGFIDVADPGLRWTQQQFAAGITVSAATDGSDPILVLPVPEEVPESEAPANKARQTTYQPSVYVLSSGEVTPFSAVFRAEGEEQPVELRIDALGQRIDDAQEAGNVPAS